MKTQEFNPSGTVMHPYSNPSTLEVAAGSPSVRGQPEQYKLKNSKGNLVRFCLKTKNGRDCGGRAPASYS